MYKSKKGDKDQESIHLTQDTTWESDKTQLNIKNESQVIICLFCKLFGYS